MKTIMLMVSFLLMAGQAIAASAVVDSTSVRAAVILKSALGRQMTIMLNDSTFAEGKLTEVQGNRITLRIKDEGLIKMRTFDLNEIKKIDVEEKGSISKGIWGIWIAGMAAFFLTIFALAGNAHNT